MEGLYQFCPNLLGGMGIHKLEMRELFLPVKLKNARIDNDNYFVNNDYRLFSKSSFV